MYYTVRRDDSELRVVLCPKCKNANVTKFQDAIPYRWGNWLLRLMQCNECQMYFTFHREDGVKEIDEKTAKKGIDQKDLDMKSNGQDVHGHSFYIIFKSKPPTITEEEYYQLEELDDDHIFANQQDKIKDFIRWKKQLPSINCLIRHKEMIQNIDFESMKYLEPNENEWFKV